MVLIDGDPVVVEKFPNGEMRIPVKWIKDLGPRPLHTMVLRYRDDHDILTMAFLKSYLDTQVERCRLAIEYLPYSRMDRCNPDFVFTLRPLCDMINHMNFESVSLLEPHSDVSPALLNRCTPGTYSDRLFKVVIKEIGFVPSEDVVVFPDAGAQKRYVSKLKSFQIIVGDKTRDFSTGRILEIKLSGPALLGSPTAVIIDDLCSYGGTFIMAAEALRKAGSGKVYLVVTHCEKSIFKGDLLKNGSVDKVFTTNILFDEEDVPQEFKDKIKIINSSEVF